MNHKLAVDTNVEVGIEAAVRDVEIFLNQFHDTGIILVGNQQTIEKTSSYQNLEGKVGIIDAPEFLPGDSDPREEFRKIKTAKNSMCIGILAAIKGAVDGFVSNGPSGFMAAAAHYKKLGSLVGKSVPYFDFPSIHKDSVAVCDAGAFGENTTVADLFVYGVLLREELISKGIAEPKIALLNMGREPNKGGQTLQEAYAVLDKYLPGFVGNREAFELHSDPDVNGFIARGDHGNFALKSAEGTHDYFLDYVAPTAGVEPEKIQRMREIVDLDGKDGGIFLGTSLNLILGHGRRSPLSSLRIAHRYLREKGDSQAVYAAVEEYASLIESLRKPNSR
ncbi:MAG: hypothetical protein KAT77_03515 [Nanoarchaeota archaeon]|nr:hypothetical protein [Nanoarchaeota archaeon]